jgi:(1->4)-alpha-D-glucan 1-alpha-D-glucosylmutase
MSRSTLARKAMARHDMALSGRPPGPRATYRLQFNASFGLQDAIALVPWLSELGVSHIYASPLFKARPQSSHGYDVCDFHELNPELGTEADLIRLTSRLRQYDMGLVLDIVPNHMGIGGPENKWWWDVLTYGPKSRFARHFDIFWRSAGQGRIGKVFLPVLRDRYSRVLQRGELRLEFTAGEFTLNYFDQFFPMAPRSIVHLLRRAGRHCKAETLRKLTNSLSETVAGRSKTAGRLSRRDARGPSPQVLLRRFCGEKSAVRKAITATLQQLNEDPESLDELIQQQHYRLGFWRCGNAQVNYRRFFNIAALAAVREEAGEVFADAHTLLKRWLDAGLIQGLRVDHVDGLADPGRYLQRLRTLAPRAWIVVEKILGKNEMLPASWPVAGTTGYDFSNLVDGLFVDPKGEKALREFYARFTGEPTDFPAIVRQKKRVVLQRLFGSEVNRLTKLLRQISLRYWRWRDFGREELAAALVELTACFPVYRTYIQPGARKAARRRSCDQGTPETGCSEADITIIRTAVATAQEQRPEWAELLDFLHELLLLRLHGKREREFVIQFQQFIGAVMAKGMEDTAFYCFNRFVALNEVGGNPGRFGISPSMFHEDCRCRQARRPDAMLATSTHDTKRSEDVRARLSLLSEIPEVWSQTVTRWSAMNEGFRSGGAPDRNAEYLFYQVLCGAWPLSAERACAYMEKAAREARQHTSWCDQDRAYEEALRGFISRALSSREFIREVGQFVASLADAGWVNSLAKTLLKLTAPGVPDIYQGCELWNLTLVDPDNRRPVDFAVRQRLLGEVCSLLPEAIWARREEGLPKLWVIRQALNLRAQRPELFSGSGSYVPCQIQGAKAAHAVVFIRGGGAITIVPRLVLGLGVDWGATTMELPAGSWRNVLTGDQRAGGAALLADLLRRFPVALLARTPIANGEAGGKKTAQEGDR